MMVQVKDLLHLAQVVILIHAMLIFASWDQALGSPYLNTAWIKTVRT